MASGIEDGVGKHDRQLEDGTTRSEKDGGDTSRDDEERGGGNGDSLYNGGCGDEEGEAIGVGCRQVKEDDVGWECV